MSSIFTEIIKNNIPCYKIAEDEFHLAFLDIYPIKKGHSLVITKKEIDKIFNLSMNDFRKLMNFTYLVSKSIKKVFYSCNRIGIIVSGFDIAHVHIHLIPINKESDLNLLNPKIYIKKNEFIKISKSILMSFNSLFI